MADPSATNIIAEFKILQDQICRGIEEVETTSSFIEDLWEREGGGGGRTRTIGGEIIEKGGVNFSHVHGHLPEEMSRALKVSPSDKFLATGISIVMHPHNPWVPIIHMNVRYFELDSGVWWFGGGIDLTPHYIIEGDGRYFHRALKEICDQFDDSYYPKFKKHADEYFYLKHRKEARGIGGIFFDHLGKMGGHKERLYNFVLKVGQSFVPIYAELIHRNKDKSFDDGHIRWQNARRSRYVEFNLLWDRGTKFGLSSDGRTESILMSMPPSAEWEYNYSPFKGSLEASTLELLRHPIDWTL